MGGLSMSGEGMSMWTRMPGQTWPGFAASFLWMWMTMMVPMMIPPFVVMLSRYRGVASRGGLTRLGAPSMAVGLGYFAVWSAIGVAICLLIVAGAAISAVVLVAATVQMSSWKAPAVVPQSGAGPAFRYGLALGLRCARSCAPLMAIALAVWGMDYRVMAALTAVITAERFAAQTQNLTRAPSGTRHGSYTRAWLGGRNS